MQFQSSSLNITCLLVVALGVIASFMLSRRRFDSNLLLFFYLVVLAFSNWSDRHVHEILYGAGLTLALLLRFEFMNPGVTKLVMVLEIGAVAAINVSYLGQVFNI